MNKIKDITTTIWLAIRYSLAFCWRNDKQDTVIRVLLTLVSSWLGYRLVVQLGHVTNNIQAAVTNQSHVLHDTLLTGLGFIALILVCNVVVNRANWYFGNRWRQRLRPANTMEIGDHKATLDIALIQSKKYDDLAKRIEDLPTSWHTRYYFAEELFMILTLTATFVFFGSSIATKWMDYAVILLLSSIPMVIAKFRIINSWWNLANELLPIHKERIMLESAYREKRAFAMAKMFDQLPPLRKTIRGKWDYVLGRYDKLRNMTVVGEMTTNLMSAIGLCIVIAHSVLSASVGIIEIGTMTVIIASARMFQNSLEEIISKFADQWNSAKGVGLIEREFFKLEPLLVTTDPVVPHFERPPGIRIEDVCFTYHGSDTIILRNVSLRFESGTINGIVGKSGGGKSTLATLLFRMQDPTSGNIYLGDINMRNIAPKTLSNIVSGMMQDVVIHERKIGEEIASSRLGEVIDLEKVAESSRFALFDEIADADPKGYDSQIGTEFDGRDFSGGEKKRLGLARVLYRETPILILDEPDAYLDPESAKKVMDNIFALRGKVTVIFITHHVSNTGSCDKVAVIDSGQVVEQGDPRELLACGGRYASMFEKDVKRKNG